MKSKYAEFLEMERDLMRVGTFEYQGTSATAGECSGTIEAADVAAARVKLEALGITVASIGPAASTARGIWSSLGPARTLRGPELIAFNQQLAALATAGLPLEQGLRLAASEAGSRRTRGAIEALATDLERGVSLPAAFDQHRAAFSPVYARLVSAAMATGNLPALLLSLGKHQQTLDRLKASMAKALAYPLVVLMGLSAVGTVLALVVLPQITTTLTQMATMKPMTPWRYYREPPPPVSPIPFSTRIVMELGPYLPVIAIGCLVILLLMPIATIALRWLRLQGVVADRVLIPLPLIGPALRQSALARFTDALAIAVGSGTDLPAALRLAGDMVGYPRLQADASAVATAIEQGKRPREAGRLRLLPQTLVDAIEVSSQNGSLPYTLEAFAALQQQQAELRVSRIPLVLLPLSLLLLALLMALLLSATVAPLSRALQRLT